MQNVINLLIIKSVMLHLQRIFYFNGKYYFLPGLIILNAWYGKFVTDNSRKHERARVIDVTVPLQCLVKDSKLILTEASKVTHKLFI